MIYETYKKKNCLLCGLVFLFFPLFLLDSSCCKFPSFIISFLYEELPSTSLLRVALLVIESFNFYSFVNDFIFPFIPGK